MKTILLLTALIFGATVIAQPTQVSPETNVVNGSRLKPEGQETAVDVVLTKNNAEPIGWFEEGGQWESLVCPIKQLAPGKGIIETQIPLVGKITLLVPQETNEKQTKVFYRFSFPVRMDPPEIQKLSFLENKTKVSANTVSVSDAPISHQSSTTQEVERVQEYTVEHSTGLFGRCENDSFPVPGKVVNVGLQILETGGISSWARLQSGPNDNPVVVRWCCEAFSSIKYKVTIHYRI